MTWEQEFRQANETTKKVRERTDKFMKSEAGKDLREFLEAGRLKELYPKKMKGELK